MDRRQATALTCTDVKIFVGSNRRAEEVKANITRNITAKLKLKVNECKSRVSTETSIQLKSP